MNGEKDFKKFFEQVQKERQCLTMFYEMQIYWRET